MSVVQFRASKHFIIRFDLHTGAVTVCQWCSLVELAPGSPGGCGSDALRGRCGSHCSGLQDQGWEQRVASDVTWSPYVTMYYGVYHQASRLYNVLYMSFIHISFIVHLFSSLIHVICFYQIFGDTPRSRLPNEVGGQTNSPSA